MAQKPMLRVEVHARALRASQYVKRAESGCASVCKFQKFLKRGTYQYSVSPPCFVPPMAMPRWHSLFQTSRHAFWTRRHGGMPQFCSCPRSPPASA